MATSAFKSTTKRASIGGSTSGDSAPRSLRRSRSLSRFSRPGAPETEIDYRDVPKGKFVNTTRGSTAPFPEISLDDLALEFFSSSSKNESDGGVVERSEREGRSVSRRGEIGRWASDTASSRRKGRSVSRGRGDAVSSSSAASGVNNAVPSDAASRRRRSVSVARSHGNAVSSGDRDAAVLSDVGSRRRRSVSVARNRGNAVSSGDKDAAVSSEAGTRRRRSQSVARYRISDSESDLDRSRNSSNRAAAKVPLGGNTQLPLASKVTAPSFRRPGRSRSQIDLSLIHDGYSSQSSALTDDDSKDTHFGKNGFEKIIRTVHAQKKPEHPSEDVVNGGLYEAMRKELRHAVDEIRTELNQVDRYTQFAHNIVFSIFLMSMLFYVLNYLLFGQAIGRNQTDAAIDDGLLSENSKTFHDSYRIREKYAHKLEQLEKRKNDLLTEMLLEEQCDREVSQTYEELPNSRASAVAEKLPRVRKRSSDKSRMSDRLIEDAERYIEDFITNLEDTDLSSFDGERSDGSSTLGAMVKGRDYAPGEAEICRTPTRSTTCPVEMDDVNLPWLQWETSHDGSPFGKTKAQTPATPKALQGDSEKDTNQLHDPSGYSLSSHGSWSPGLFHTFPMDKEEELCPTKTGNDYTSRFDMDEYRKLQNNEEILFEMYRERNRIGLGGLLLCTGVLH